MRSLKKQFISTLINEEKDEAKSEKKVKDKADIIKYASQGITDKLASSDIPVELIKIDYIAPEKDGCKIKFSINTNSFEIVCNKAKDSAGIHAQITNIKLPAILSQKVDNEKLEDPDYMFCVSVLYKLTVVKAFADHIAWLVCSACEQALEKDK